MLDRPDHPFHVSERPDVLHLIGGEKIDVDANRPRNASIIMVFIHAVLRCRQPDIGDLRKPSVKACFLLQFRIETY